MRVVLLLGAVVGLATLAFASAAATSAGPANGVDEAAEPADAPASAELAKRPARPTVTRSPRRRADAGNPVEIADAAVAETAFDEFEVLPAGTRVDLVPRRLSGRVVEADGRPVAGVKVALHSTWLSDEEALESYDVEVAQSASLVVGFAGARSTTVTADDGRFSLRHFAGGARTLSVERDGRLAWLRHDPPVSGPVDVVLQPPGRVEGCVTDAAGSPVEGAGVCVRLVTTPIAALRELVSPPADGWTEYARTDAYGRWSVEAVPHGEFVVGAWIVGTDGIGTVTRPAGSTWADVRLPR